MPVTESLDPSRVTVEQLAAAADRSKLKPFEGRDVIASAIKITRAGDGLSEALAVDPEELHHGDEVFVVLRTEVAEVTFVPVPKAEGSFIRRHVLRTEEATIIDGGLVSEVVAKQAERIRLAREKAAGVHRLFEAEGSDPADDALLAAHDAGDHASGLVEGCPACDAEIEAEQAESGLAAVPDSDESDADRLGD